MSWQRVLFWQRKNNRIYTLCPEIREIMDEMAIAKIKKALKVAVTAPVLVPWFFVCVVLEYAGEFGAWMGDNTPFRGLFREPAGKLHPIHRAHKILPVEEIQRRLNGTVISKKT